MTTEWKDLPTMKDVANVPEGWEIQFADRINEIWRTWDGKTWSNVWRFRARPRQPKTKTITLRKALMFIEGNGHYASDVEVNDAIQARNYFVCWLGEPYTVEVPA